MRCKTPVSAGFSIGHLLVLAGLGCAGAAAAYVGEWKSFSDYNPVNALIGYHGSLFAGSQGGIRKIQSSPPYQETDFNNASGLLDVRIVGFAIDADDRLWAASRSGQLFRMEGDRWSAWGKSYKSAGWVINTRAVASAGRYLLVGSEKGLSFFDRTSGVAAVNLTKFGGLGFQGITGLLIRRDSLFIATGSAVLKTAVDWSNVLSSKFGGTIFDPQIWKPVPEVAPPPAFAERLKGDEPDPSAVDSSSEPDPASDPSSDPSDMAAASDPAVANPVELSLLDGRVTAHDSGTILVAPRKVKALLGRPLLIDGKTVYRDPAYPQLSLDFQAALDMDGTLFLGGAGGLARYTGGNTLAYMPTPVYYPQQKVASVSAWDGKVALETPYSLFEFDGKSWLSGAALPLYSVEVLMNELRNVAYASDGSVLVGGWGYGMIRMADGKTLRTWSGGNSCIKSVVGKDYSVVHSMSDPRGNDLWFTLLDNVESKPEYSMAHLDLRTGKVSCPELKGNSYHTYSTRILSDTLFGVASESGIQLYRYGLGGEAGNIRSAGSINAGSGSDNGRDLAMDDSRDRIWALMNGKLGYVDSVSVKLAAGKPLEWKNFEASAEKNCNVLETDIRHGLWAGCENGIFHIQSAAMAEASGIEHFTVEDGLLSDRILDIAMDVRTGKLWAATENGVNLYETASHPPIEGSAGIKVYPNPFRKQHRLLILDNLPDGASATIFTQSGSAVRHFGSKDAMGHQFQWDGRNSAGAKVKPGVYFYSIEAGGKGSRGKIIVDR